MRGLFMVLIYYNYEFKSSKYQELWKDELENTISNMQKYYKNRMSLNGILFIVPIDTVIIFEVYYDDLKVETFKCDILISGLPEN